MGLDGLHHALHVPLLLPQVHMRGVGVDDLGWMDWRERLPVDRLAWLR